jgi:hypothetical protein
LNRLLPHLILANFLTILLVLLYDLHIVSSIGVGLVVFLTINFLDELGKKLPIIELVLLMAGLQWIIGPLLDYRSNVSHFKYYMYVDESTYMGVVVPGMLFFVLGAFLFKKSYSFADYIEYLKYFLKQHPRFPYLLIAGGMIASFLQSGLPAGLSFIFFLLSQVKFIGLTYLLFKPESTYKWLIFIGIMLLTLLTAIKTAMFHDFFLWSILMFSFVAYNLRLSLLMRLGSVLVGIVIAFIIQSVKADFRKQVWSGRNSDPLEVFTNMAMDRITNIGEHTSDEQLDEVNVRLNQGWIISSIIKNIPRKESFAEGETIIEAIKASILPRFLDPGKKFAGGRENFEKFTGLTLARNTSMGISLMGESYANFGKFGGTIFMGVWGVFLAICIRYVLTLSQKYPTLILWLPLIFLQVVKAETELVVVLNHFIKSSMLVLFLFWMFRRYGFRV